MEERIGDWLQLIGRSTPPEAVRDSIRKGDLSPIAIRLRCRMDLQCAMLLPQGSQSMLLGFSPRRERSNVNSTMATTFLRDLRHDFDELACNRPELWAKCYPKIYEGVDGGEYYSAKLVGYFLLTVAIKIEQPEVQLYQHFNETVEAIWASRLVGNRVPIFWLSREITEALKL